MISLYGGGNITKIGVINIPHETYHLRQNEYDWLYGKLNRLGKIVSIMDNDRTGKIEAKWLKDNYNILPILIPKKYNAKDFAELVMNNNINLVYKLIKETVKYINDERTKYKLTWDSSKRDDSLPY